MKYFAIAAVAIVGLLLLPEDLPVVVLAAAVGAAYEALK